MIPQPPQIPSNWTPGHDWTYEAEIARKALDANRKAINRNKGTSLKPEKGNFNEKDYKEPNYG